MTIVPCRALRASRSRMPRRSTYPTSSSRPGLLCIQPGPGWLAVSVPTPGPTFPHDTANRPHDAVGKTDVGVIELASQGLSREGPIATPASVAQTTDRFVPDSAGSQSALSRCWLMTMDPAADLLDALFHSSVPDARRLGTRGIVFSIQNTMGFVGCDSAAMVLFLAFRA